MIKELAQEDWVGSVWPLLPEGLPVTTPTWNPIWAAAHEADLPIMYHGFTIETPYFPGTCDVWDNPAMGRCAGQTWAASASSPSCSWAAARSLPDGARRTWSAVVAGYRTGCDV